MIRRFLEKSVCEALDISRVVHLTGIRQCGKTTLVESVPLSQKTVRSLDDEMLLRVATDDPMGFVKHGIGQTMVIDERGSCKTSNASHKKHFYAWKAYKTITYNIAVRHCKGVLQLPRDSKIAVAVKCNKIYC